MSTNPTLPASGPQRELESTRSARAEVNVTRAEDLVTRLGERLAMTANARQIYGEAVTVHDRTVIPVAKVGYGVGAGSGGRTGAMEGGGGGVGVKPVGFIEITKDGTRFVAYTAPRKLLAAVAAAFVAGYFLGRRKF